MQDLGRLVCTLIVSGPWAGHGNWSRWSDCCGTYSTTPPEPVAEFSSVAKAVDALGYRRAP